MIQAKPLPTTLDEDKRPEVLMAELTELENSISHLKRSNAELEGALAESPDDQDFREAIAENAALIAKRSELAMRHRILLGVEDAATAAASLAAAATAAATTARVDRSSGGSDGSDSGSGGDGGGGASASVMVDEEGGLFL